MFILGPYGFEVHHHCRKEEGSYNSKNCSGFGWRRFLQVMSTFWMEYPILGCEAPLEADRCFHPALR